VAIAPDESDNRLRARVSTPSVPKPAATATGTPFGQAGSASAPIATPSGTSFIQNLAKTVAEQNVAKGLNPDGTTPKAPTRVEQNEAKKAAGPAYPAPAGYYWSWIGTDYKLYKSPTSSVVPAGNGGANVTNPTDTTDTTTGTPTTSVEVLKAMLKGLGFKGSVVDASASFLNSLVKEGLDYDNAVQVFLNSRDYTLKNGTKVTSPFYEQYGFLNEGLTKPRTASELYNAVEGYKELQIKYGFSDRYLSPESLKNYVKNNVTVADLDERSNAARLAAINADPAKSEALIKLGYIANSAGLQDFYMDSKIGTEQLELNRNTGAFVAEAIRRAGSGLLVENIQIANYKKIAASLTGKGYSEAQVAQLASTGFQNVAQNLQPTVTLSGIYEKTPGNEATTSLIQSELQEEEFMNMASARRKRLEQQNIKAFQGTAGTTQTSLRTSSTGSTL